MAVISYIAKRNISGGRLDGVNYLIEIPLTDFTRSVKRHGSQSTSLSGIKFETFHRIDVSRQVKTVPIKDVDLLDQMREFLDSCAGGEVFTIDLLGTPAEPDNPIPLTLDGDYSEALVDLSGFYSFSFKAIE